MHPPAPVAQPRLEIGGSGDNALGPKQLLGRGKELRLLFGHAGAIARLASPRTPAKPRV